MDENPASLNKNPMPALHAHSSAVGTCREATQVQGAENKGALPDEAADSFTQLFGDPGDVKAVDPAGSQELDWDSLPLDADGLGGIGDWHDRWGHPGLVHCEREHTGKTSHEFVYSFRHPTYMMWLK